MKKTKPAYCDKLNKQFITVSRLFILEALYLRGNKELKEIPLTEVRYGSKGGYRIYQPDILRFVYYGLPKAALYSFPQRKYVAASFASRAACLSLSSL